MVRNKNRIYLAFYARSGHDNYHVAILICPKNSKGIIWRLHVMNRPNPSLVTQQEWVYEYRTFIGRTSHLLALGLLGKTEKSGEEMSEVLRGVEIVQDDITWTCKSWALSAIEFMLSEGFIPEISTSIDTLYEVGSAMSLVFSKLTPEERQDLKIPTFNSAGVAMQSEVE